MIRSCDVVTVYCWCTVDRLFTIRTAQVRSCRRWQHPLHPNPVSRPARSVRSDTSAGLLPELVVGGRRLFHRTCPMGKGPETDSHFGGSRYGRCRTAGSCHGVGNNAVAPGIAYQPDLVRSPCHAVEESWSRQGDDGDDDNVSMCHVCCVDLAPRVFLWSRRRAPRYHLVVETHCL
jgi:hypothetical protein